MNARRIFVAVLTLTVLLPVLAAAQFGGGVVKDPWNLIQNTASARNTLKTILELRAQLERMDQNLETFDELVARDLAGWFAEADALAAAANWGSTPFTYAVPDVLGAYLEAMQPYLAFSPELQEIIDYGGIFEIWNEAAIDTYAATLSASTVDGADHLASELERLSMLEDVLGAGGNLQALQALGAIQVHSAQEIAKLNRLLASIVSNQSTAFGHQAVLRGTSEATNRYWIAAEATPIVEYDDTSGFTGLPPGLD